MDLSAFVKSVKIPVKPIELRGQNVWVRALSMLEIQDCLMYAEKWAKERAKSLKEKGVDRIDIAMGEDSGKKYSIDTVAINLKLQAAMALSDEDGSPAVDDVEKLKVLVFEKGALLESEVRQIVDLVKSFEPAKEETEKNSDTSGS